VGHATIAAPDQHALRVALEQVGTVLDRRAQVDPLLDTLARIQPAT
jgi:hypothetical protein